MPVDFLNRQKRDRKDHRLRLLHHLRIIFNYDEEFVIVTGCFEKNPVKLRGFDCDLRAALRL